MNFGYKMDIVYKQQNTGLNVKMMSAFCGTVMKVRSSN